MIKRIVTNKLFQNIGVYTVSNIISASIPFLLLPILTRFLTPNDFGITATFQSLVGLFSFIVGLNTQTAVIRRFYDEKTVKFSEYISTCLFILVISTGILSLCLIPFSAGISQLSEFPRAWLWAVIVVAFFQYIFSVLLGVWQVRKKVYLYALLQNAQTILNISISLLFIVILQMNWEGRILAQTISIAIFGLIGLVILIRMRFVKLKINRKYFSDALRFGVPLIPYSFTGWILLSMDRIFINKMIGLNETGLYSVAFQICLIVSLFQISFNTAWVPWHYENIKKNDPNTNQKIVKFSYAFIIGNFVFAALLVLLAPPFLKFFLGKSFYGASDYLWWLALAQAANAIHIITVTYINYHSRNIYLTYAAIFTAAVHIPIIYLLIKANGTMGAAQAFFISNLMTSILTFLIAGKVHKMPWLLHRLKPEPIR
ncbi:MAG: lipopolysaccharide biosynthesis protein [Chitinophagales bacterium]